MAERTTTDAGDHEHRHANDHTRERARDRAQGRAHGHADSANNQDGAHTHASALRAAVADAVARSRPPAAAMADRIDRLVRTLDRDTPATARDDASLAELRRAEARVRAHVTAGLQELVDERLRSVDTIDIALFGRTGVGKSSLIEAVSGGDGQTISPGESDFTTAIRALGWASCRLVDTPGIGGWGRAGPSERLEEQARRAVVTADLVLLCFDNQNQQEAEFQKVADWIAAYRKPAIAVLNCRSKAWRDPARVPRRQTRRKLQRTVAEHAATIRAELTRIGLPGVPLVAIQTQKAVAARAAHVYRGPYPDTIRQLRTRLGPDRLLRYSNLPALEDLLTTALTTDAVSLRLGGLTRQVRATLDVADGELDLALREPARRFAEQYERGIEDYLRILGRPQPPDHPVQRPEDIAYVKLLARLAQLEVLRGGSFTVPVEGEARRHARHLLGAALGPLRDDAQSKADALVERAFENRVQVTAEEFEAAVLDRTAIDRAATEAIDTFRRYIEDRIKLTVADVRADLSAVANQHAEIGGDRGRRRRTAGYAAGFLGSGLSAGLGIAALTNIWNPAGWALGFAAAVTGIATRLFSRYGRKSAAKQMEEARTNGRTDARRAVGDFFDKLGEAAAAACVRDIRQAYLVALSPEVESAVAFREIEAAARRGMRAVQEVRDVTPETGDPVAVLTRAVRLREQRAGIRDGRQADSLWLGGSWTDDPEGLVVTDEPEPETTRRHRSSPSFGPGLLDRLRSALFRPRPEPHPGAGRAFLARMHTVLDGEPAAAHCLAELDALAADGRPRIVVTGDYSSGKSSFIRRLLLEAGLPVPDRLTVAGGPETERAEEYAWDGMLLIDTPGFQSGREEHARAARAAMADAAVVIHLFTPSGFAVGDRSDLRLLLRGDAPRGVPAKLDRALFVVNRVDDLAPDPLDAPEEFRQLADAQEERLAAALARLAGTADRTDGTGGPGAQGPGTRDRLRRDRIVSVAADPFETTPASAAGFDPYRSWDGFRGFAKALVEVRNTLGSTAVDVTLLHGGLVRLGALRHATRADSHDLEQQVAQLAALGADLTSAARIGRTLLRDEVGTAGRLAEDFTATLAQDALSATDQDQRALRAKRCRNWSTDKEFQQILGRWHSDFAERVERWHEDVRAAVTRRTGSPAFKTAFPEHRPDIDIGFLVTPATTASAKAVLHSAESAGDLTLLLDADRIQEIAEIAGHELAPYEATELLEAFDAGRSLLHVVHAVVEVAALLDSLNKESRLKELREALLQGMRQSAETWTSLLEHSDGPESVAEQCLALEAAATELGEQRLDRLEKIAAAQDLITRCNDLMAVAERALRPGAETPRPGTQKGEPR
ncbi:GTPase [Streptomyces sp. NPDC005805]|uniref:GTPase n=1 Tax=Streptomyces sp. NPDC005805 TaxID=3157068 RepID=UPI0033DE69DB